MAVDYLKELTRCEEELDAIRALYPADHNRERVLIGMAELDWMAERHLILVEATKRVLS